MKIHPQAEDICPTPNEIWLEDRNKGKSVNKYLFAILKITVTENYRSYESLTWMMGERNSGEIFLRQPSLARNLKLCRVNLDGVGRIRVALQTKKKKLFIAESYNPRREKRRRATKDQARKVGEARAWGTL